MAAATASERKLNKRCDKTPSTYTPIYDWRVGIDTAPYLDILRRFNPQLHLAVIVAEHGYLDIVVDDDGFVLIPGEYEHWFLLPWYEVTMPDWLVADYP
jgi:hypothetical protein